MYQPFNRLLYTFHRQTFNALINIAKPSFNKELTNWTYVVPWECNCLQNYSAMAPFDNARYWYLIYLCQTDDSQVIIITSAEPRESRLVYRWPARHVLGSCIVTKDFSSAGSGNLEPGRPFASPAEKPHLLHHISFFYVDQKYQIGGSEILTSLSFGFSLSGSNQDFFSLVIQQLNCNRIKYFSKREMQWKEPKQENTRKMFEEDEEAKGFKLRVHLDQLRLPRHCLCTAWY